MSDGTALSGAAPTDVQARPPSAHLSLSRVGVTGVQQVVRIRSNGSEQLFYAELDCYVDLGPKQKGAHMSRFEEVIEEAIEEVVLREAFKAETLAAHIAERVRDRQGGLRAEVFLQFAEDYVELLAHEFEHILEQVDGVVLRDEIGSGRAWLTESGAYERA